MVKAHEQFRSGGRSGSATATIKDVARMAGVSPTTVSHALSGRRPVARDTLAKVEEAVEALDYRPNANALSLRTGRRMAISLIVPDIVNPFFAQLARGAEDAASERGFQVYLCNTDLRPEREAEHLSRALARVVDGVVLAATTTSPESRRAVTRLVEEGVPLILVDEMVPGLGVGGVFADNVDGGRLAAEHLLAVGCRTIAVINGPEELPSAQQRQAGFERALAIVGESVPAIRQRSVPYRIDEGERATAEILDVEPAIDGLFAADDLLAIGAIRAIHERGLRVPDDVAVCGFDDISWMEMVTPSLTTVSQPIEEIGARAVELLLGCLEGARRYDEVVVVPVSLTERASTQRSRGP